MSLIMKLVVRRKLRRGVSEPESVRLSRYDCRASSQSVTLTVASNNSCKNIRLHSNKCKNPIVVCKKIKVCFYKPRSSLHSSSETAPFHSTTPGPRSPQRRCSDRLCCSTNHICWLKNLKLCKS